MAAVRQQPWSDDDLALVDEVERVVNPPVAGVIVAVLVGVFCVAQFAGRAMAPGVTVPTVLLVLATIVVVVRTRLGDVAPTRRGGSAFRVDPGLVWASAYIVLLALVVTLLPAARGLARAWGLGGEYLADVSLLTVVASTGAIVFVAAALATLRLRVEVDDVGLHDVSASVTHHLLWRDVERVTLVHEDHAVLGPLGRVVRAMARRLPQRASRDTAGSGMRLHAIATRGGEIDRCERQWEMRGDVATALARAVTAHARRHDIEIVMLLPGAASSDSTASPAAAVDRQQPASARQAAGQR